MQNVGPITLTPNSPLQVNVRGTTVQILSSGNSAGLTIQFLQGSQVQYTVEDVLTGWKIKPAGGFDSLTITSATGDTISAIVTGGDIDIQFLESSVEVTNGAGNPVQVAVVSGTINMTATNVGINNTSENPVPVSLVSEPGAPVAVSGTVNIGNGAGSPVLVQVEPPASTPADVGAVAVGTSGGALIAASAGRKGLRIRNAGPGQLGITAAAGTTFANAAVVLQVGDTWNERDAPQAAWYAVSDTSTSAIIQTVS
ncbi:hypothetical protein R69619_02732 [Paraburkholderia nemoris]|uniref:hypothetical protein n=1 Tax=Paraburkholderia nemoris TaxID=2793076 RepID=UPI00190E4A30|nr:hypothetical protein [Paraburkholderia nemoris]MBK3741180.1 hypothetical protein [Paraburkholderia aspalathi]CAE6746707.1 hypothetical protein R69619_02732 [Paraburkholderia nemoris]